MKFLTVYLRIYGDCMAKALHAIGKNLWTLLLPMALMTAFTFAGQIVGSMGLGIVGGFILGLLMIAVYSSYLHFVSGLVRTGKVHFSELRDSFGRLFWPVMGVSFVVWIASLLIGMVASGTEQGGAISLLFMLAVALAVFINPTPEVIYDRGSHSGMATLQKSFSFTQENWIEWYLPNLALGALGYFAFINAARLGTVGFLAAELLLGAFLHLVMVFRGHLFLALDGTSHRQRMFNYRNR